jgi:hypothetical protein
MCFKNYEQVLVCAYCTHQKIYSILYLFAITVEGGPRK